MDPSVIWGTVPTVGMDTVPTLTLHHLAGTNYIFLSIEPALLSSPSTLIPGLFSQKPGYGGLCLGFFEFLLLAPISQVLC